MTVSAVELRDAAQRLHGYLLQTHWSGQLLRGPDPGIRLNWRAGRFVKSYLPRVAWRDDLVYMQAQGYWILSNLLMANLFGDARCTALAFECASAVHRVQDPRGYWTYPNPEWRGRITTVEGDYAAIGLLDCHTRQRRPSLLHAAIRWYRFLLGDIGVRRTPHGAGIRYFANDSAALVPNNTTLTLRLLARIDRDSDEVTDVALHGDMISWLRHVQLPSGELPYRLYEKQTVHFICYQYNAFEFLDLLDYFDITGDTRVLDVMRGISRFLETALTDHGIARYDCQSARPEVVYYTSAVSAALSQATELGFGDSRLAADRGYQWVLDQQSADGSFEFFSRRNYRVLTDRRSYPRYLAMILYHLLLELRRSQPGIQANAAAACARGPRESPASLAGGIRV